ncbi:MAG: SUMF1/EgtB/PvdO family nonheme iron enzyme [Verrucomicrobiia bacterium]
MRELIGQKLGDYEILSELGRGAMGIVYKARQYSLDRHVALKVLAPELARDEHYIERFKREAIIAATIVHPNIVTVYDAGAHLDLDTGERLHYFAMEYVEGETVQQRLVRQDCIPADEVAAIGVRVAEGLASAWKKARIIHRDIKPSNIFLSRDGKVKIGDLGLARVVGDAQSSLTATGAIIGTAYYMSPEQARGEGDVDFRGDIYSLGCTLYRMLCGKHLYEGAFASVIVKHLTEPPPSIRMVMPDCPMALVKVIEKMLAKHPSGRHQTYAELIEELRQAHEQVLAGDAQEEDEAEAHAPVSLKQMALGGIAAVVAIAGVLWWAPWQERDAGTLPANSRQADERRQHDVGSTLSESAGVPPAEARKDTPSPGPGTATPAPVIIASVTKAAESSSAAKIETSPKPSNVAANPLAAGVTPALAAKPVAADPFLKEVAGLPPELQVARVVAKLKELNPTFDGRETHKIENGAVTDLALSTIGVMDITPLKALPLLKRLTLASASAAQKGSLSDLSPLKGLPLTWLYCQNNPISDLSPLRDMPLTVLSLGVTQVSDLSPLAGMKLIVLSVNDTAVSDLSPLAGMPLSVLWCNNSKVTDLSPLQGMPLRELRCDFVAARDAATLRGVKTLTKINGATAAAFWLQVGPIVASAAASSRVQTGQSLMTSIGMELVPILPGEFMLGSTPEEREWATSAEGRRANPIFTQAEGEQPRKTVIRQGFWLGRTEVTVGQWRQFVKATGYVTDGETTGASYAPSGPHTWKHVDGANWRDPHFGSEPKDNDPVCCISWNDAMAFCAWLDRQEEGRFPVGCKMRLPTEAEWEYACRAGKQTKFWWGDRPSDGENRLNWNWGVREPGFVKPVDYYGARGRNPFGLADTLGNLWEWCLDSFDDRGAHAQQWITDGHLHVIRGGAFGGSPGLPRCALREQRTAKFSSAVDGFRVACGMPPAKTGTNRQR